MKDEKGERRGPLTPNKGGTRTCRQRSTMRPEGEGVAAGLFLSPPYWGLGGLSFPPFHPSSFILFLPLYKGDH